MPDPPITLLLTPRTIDCVTLSEGKCVVIRALGKTVTLKPGERLTKHDFLLPLSDILLDFVDKDLYGPTAAFYSQLGCSLAHDFVNLSRVAGQLLWLVDTAPVRTGTPDSHLLSMLAESYMMCLRSACDVIAVIIHTFCIEEKRKGQVPKESFNDLIDWIEKNPSRVPERIGSSTAKPAAAKRPTFE